ncbi:MAG: ORF6N domain-containing protein [Flavobacteriales bacterium]
MAKKELLIVENKIYFIRGKKVMLDSDLAEVYGVETKRLNEAVRRNSKRFPPAFMFPLTDKEWDNLRSQIATSSLYGGRRYNPLVFTEHGAVMLASVLNSPKAISASILVVEAFVKLRNILSDHKDLARKIEALEAKYDGQFNVVFEALNELINPSQPRKRVGYKRSDEKE